jgi:phosphoserine phosphatase
MHVARQSLGTGSAAQVRRLSARGKRVWVVTGTLREIAQAMADDRHFADALLEAQAHDIVLDDLGGNLFRMQVFVKAS